MAPWCLCGLCPPPTCLQRRRCDSAALAALVAGATWRARERPSPAHAGVKKTVRSGLRGALARPCGALSLRGWCVSNGQGSRPERAEVPQLLPPDVSACVRPVPLCSLRPPSTQHEQVLCLGRANREPASPSAECVTRCSPELPGLWQLAADLRLAARCLSVPCSRTHADLPARPASTSCQLGSCVHVSVRERARLSRLGPLAQQDAVRASG
jgi:hypothetical protein